MTGAAAAFAWEFRRRHRWGLTALIAYLAVLLGMKLWIIGTGRLVWNADPFIFALMTLIAMTCLAIYLLAVFCFGSSGDLAARQSIYPARLFTLPVTTDALVAWPMLYGIGAIVLLWVGTRTLGYWPPELAKEGIRVPIVWPMLLAASLLAWAQALTWMPYGFTGVRVVVAMLWLIAIDSVVLLAIEFRWREPGLIAFLAPHVPLAYLVARVAVARARRGETPQWRFALGRASERSGTPFASASRAQDWFEWRRHGRSLPALVAMVLPFELLLLWAAGLSRALVLTIVLGALFVPVVLATFAAAMVRKSGTNSTDSHSLSPFLATRPVTSESLIAAKLRTTLRSTIAAWLVVAALLPVALVWSGAWQVLKDTALAVSVQMGMTRVLVVSAFVIVAAIATTWKQLVQSLYVGLSGREWVVRWSVFVSIAIVSLAVPLLIWVLQTSRAIVWLWDSFATILAVLAIVKVLLSAWAALRLWRTRAVRDRTIVVVALAWLAGVMTLYGIFIWLWSTSVIPKAPLLFAAIVLVPLARLSAAPLALEWNRHR